MRTWWLYTFGKQEWAKEAGGEGVCRVFDQSAYKAGP
jgi:hypothetical protein